MGCLHALGVVAPAGFLRVVADYECAAVVGEEDAAKVSEGGSLGGLQDYGGNLDRGRRQDAGRATLGSAAAGRSPGVSVEILLFRWERH